MKTTNTNVLAGLRCPKCQSLGPFTINISCWAKVSDDGVEDTWEHEWQGNSSCTCGACNYTRLVRDFEPKQKPGSGPRRKRI